MPWRASAEPETGLAIPAVAEPEAESSTRTSTGDARNDWLCAWCLNRVASEKDRFAYDGKDEFDFANPEGMRFEIITFSRTLGCRGTGTPTLEHTWFPGHAWSYCRCDRCGLHLGWHYTGQHTFAGLIKARITRARYVMN